jgi:opacity protein-like surface antigen
MKRLILILFAILILALPSFGQSAVKPVIYAGGGLALPMNPTVFKDYWKMGFGGGGGIGIQINPNVEIIGKVFYNTFPLDADKILSEEGVTGVTIDGLDFQALEFGADIKYLFPAGGPEGKFKFALIGGVGLAQAKFTDVTITGDGSSITLPASSISETKVAFGFGAGFDYMFSPKAGFWFEGRYNIVSTSGQSTGYLPMRVGVKFLLGQ